MVAISFIMPFKFSHLILGIVAKTAGSLDPLVNQLQVSDVVDLNSCIHMLTIVTLNTFLHGHHHYKFKFINENHEQTLYVERERDLCDGKVYKMCEELQRKRDLDMCFITEKERPRCVFRSLDMCRLNVAL